MPLQRGGEVEICNDRVSATTRNVPFDHALHELTAPAVPRASISTE